MSGSFSENIARALSQDFVESGACLPGDRLPTVKDLAQKYNASLSTVRKALDQMEGSGVIVKRQGSGIYLAEGPTRQADARSLFIGYVGPIANDFINLEIYSGVEHAARHAGYQATITSSGYDYETERAQVWRLVEAGCKAIILSPSLLRTDEQVAHDYLKTELQDFPIVLVDIAFAEQNRPRVVFDNYQAGYDMTRQLITEGHRRIAFMRSDLTGSNHHLLSNRERFRGYGDALADSALPLRDEDQWSIPYPLSPDEMTIARHLMRWQEDEECPSALICTEDNAVIRAASLAREIGIRVPQDLCMVGFDNLPHGRIFRPQFNTTGPDFAQAGRIAGEIALEAIHGGTRAVSGRVYVLPVPLIQRDVYELHLGEADGIRSPSYSALVS